MLDALFERIARQHILVVGDLMLDHYVWGDASRLSPEAPVPVVLVGKDTHTAGGAANVALNLTALGASATLSGTVGNDVGADTLRSILTGAGIGANPIATRTDTPTILKTRVVVRSQQLCRIDREGPAAQYAIESEEVFARIDDAVGAATAVIISDYAKGVVTPDLIARVQRAAQRHGCLVAYDPKPSNRLAYSGFGLMTPNSKEALELAGIEARRGEPFPGDAVARAIFERYAPEHLVITLGGDGMLLCERGEIVRRIPTYAREVFDVSGAGDTVIAALTAAMAAGASMEDAAHFANMAAGVVVGKIGTATAQPDEIVAFEKRMVANRFQQD